MEKRNHRKFYWAGSLLAAFILWTLAVKFIDVRPMGPLGSEVGLATLNGTFHALTGVHMGLYTLTDWLSLVQLAIVFGFGIQGLVQWIKRGDLRKVDPDLLILGGFYVAVMAVFLFFEYAALNYRPILIEGVLEASYPSSTTMLVLCVMPTARMRLNKRRPLCVAIDAFTAFMVIARLVSGVHWLTDIIGGILLSAGLVTQYAALVHTVK